MSEFRNRVEGERSYLLRYASLQLRDAAAAEDAVQETLLAADRRNRWRLAIRWCLCRDIGAAPDHERPVRTCRRPAGRVAPNGSSNALLTAWRVSGGSSGG